RAVVPLAGDAALLARPAGPLGRDPDARDTRGADLAGAQPAVDVAGGVDVGARREALLGDLGAAYAIEAEVAHGGLVGIVGPHIPALAPVDQRVGLDAARGVLVLVLLVIVELDEHAVGD